MIFLHFLASISTFIPVLISSTGIWHPDISTYVLTVLLLVCVLMGTHLPTNTTGDWKNEYNSFGVTFAPDWLRFGTRISHKNAVNWNFQKTVYLISNQLIKQEPYLILDWNSHFEVKWGFCLSRNFTQVWTKIEGPFKQQILSNWRPNYLQECIQVENLIFKQLFLPHI